MTKRCILLLLASCSLLQGCFLLPQKQMEAPANALERLKMGNERFAKHHTTHPRQSADRVAETAKGQQPFAIVITCSDSRVSPEIIFDEGIGDLFVIRNAGNLVEEEDVLASVEYAVEHLNVETVIVLGHEHCGAIEAMIIGERDPKTTHLNNIIAQIRGEPEEQQALRGNAQSSGTLIHHCVMANVAHGMVVLQKEFQHKLGEEVTIVGGVYDIETGVVSFMEEPSLKSVQPQ